MKSFIPLPYCCYHAPDRSLPVFPLAGCRGGEPKRNRIPKRNDNSMSEKANKTAEGIAGTGGRFERRSTLKRFAAGQRLREERDVELKHLAIAFAVELNLDGVRIDGDVLADDVQQLLAQQRQIIRTAARRALPRHDDLQALLGDSGAFLSLRQKVVEKFHGHQVPKRRASMRFFSVMNRCGRASPR